MRDSVMLAAFAAIVLVACGKPESAAMETVESLAANPERLKTLREQGLLRRVGSDKTGHWEVIEKPQ